jgi:hypothetical protein
MSVLEGGFAQHPCKRIMLVVLGTQLLGVRRVCSGTIDAVISL